MHPSTGRVENSVCTGEIGWCPQREIIDWSLTVRQNITLGVEMRRSVPRADLRRDFRELADALHLTDYVDRTAETISGEPLAFFMFLVPGLAGGTDDPAEYGRFAFAGMCGFLGFRAATNAMSDVANDRKWGVFALYTLQGGSALGYLASIVLFTLAVFAVQITLVALSGLAIFGREAFDATAA
jgi:hypothetical protein